jgi:RNA polymerase sigma-32 factor
MSFPIVADSVQSYLAEVNRYKLLTPEEERSVAERYFKTKSIEDAHTLVISNLRYVVKIALEFRNYGVRLADLIQEGNIGLMMAVKKFNPFKGFRLITYATWWIKSFIQDFILKSKGLVRHATRDLKRKLFYRSPSELTSGDEAENREEAGVFFDDLSLNASIAESGATHMDMLREEGPGPLEAVSEKQTAALVKREVTDALACLNDKERMVIEQRVMSEEPESLQGLGDKLGLTRERVRQIETQALKKLGRSLARMKEAIFTPEPA